MDNSPTHRRLDLHIPSLIGVVHHGADVPTARIHFDRAFGGDLDHRGADRALAARRADGARGGQAAQCVNNQKQIGIALHNYHNANSVFPPAKIYSTGTYTQNDPAKVGLVLNTTALTMILGFLEQTPLLNAYNFSLPSCNAINGAINATLVGGSTSFLANTTVVGTLVSTYVCPSDPQQLPHTLAAPSPYAMLNGQRSSYLLTGAGYYENYNGPYLRGDLGAIGLAIFSGADWSVSLNQVTDGTSNTLFGGESPMVKYNSNLGGYWGAGAWTSTHGLAFAITVSNGSYYCYLPNASALGCGGLTSNPSNLVYAWGWGSKHPGGLNMLFADGSVKFIKNSINPTTWYSIHTMGAGDIVSADSF